MSDEITTINDIVTQHVEKNKEKEAPKDVIIPTKVEEKVETKVEETPKLDADGKPIVEAEKKDEKPADEVKPNPLDEFLKKHNVTSLDALEEKLKPKEEKTLSPEEKERQDSLYKAKLQSFAVENGDMKLEDFHQLETLKQKADAEIVYPDFAAEYREDHEDDFEDMTEPEIEEKVKQAFEKKYKLNSEDNKVKQVGLDKLAKIAGQKRSPLESSYNTVKEKFDAELDIRNNYPNYDKAVRQVANESIPENYSFYKGKDGDEDVSIDIELSKEDKVEITDNIAKKIQNPDTYSIYKKGDLAALKTLAQSETERFIENKYKEQAKTKMAEVFMGRGLKKGSEVGAKNSFAVNQARPQATEKTANADAKQEVLESLKKDK